MLLSGDSWQICYASRVEGLAEDTDLVRALCRWAKMAPSRLAKEAGLTPTTITRPYAGTATTRISTPTLEKLKERFPGFTWARPEAEHPETDPLIDYEHIDILPTYAGMGGGGTGEGSFETALISRRLIREELQSRPEHLLLINVRGDSMEPLFRHGDQLLIDRRDVRPTQPGPFALLYDDGYVVKNVELLRKKGKVRVFSSNPAYEPEEFDPEEITIMGRPVWFARRL